VVLPLLVTEFGDWCPWLAVHLVRWAARQLGDPASCERYQEEWIANLNEVPGKLARLVAAFGYLVYLPGMRRSIRRRRARPRVGLYARALPPLSHPFVGRVEELGFLLERLRTTSARRGGYEPVYVVGIGGIGKTTLATVCAHRMRNDFPDGQIFLNVSSLATANDYLNSILVYLGVPISRIPSHQDGKRALFREVVSGRRVLLVLDNIESDHVPALFGGDSPCPVLITSRQPPSHGLGSVLALETLDEYESRELLRNRLGHRIDAEPEAVEELVHLLGGLPLAIAIVAAMLAQESATVASVVRRLNEVNLTDTVPPSYLQSAFDNLYQMQAPEGQVLLRRLSLLPDAPFGVRETALLTGATPSYATRLVGSLLHAGLVICVEGAAERYILHHLIRSCASERLLRDETPECLQDLLDRLKRHGLDPPST
jgi:NB-ARC domain